MLRIGKDIQVLGLGTSRSSMRGDGSVDEYIKELADTLNYIVMCADEQDLTLADIMCVALIKADDKNKAWYKSLQNQTKEGKKE